MEKRKLLHVAMTQGTENLQPYQISKTLPSRVQPVIFCLKLRGLCSENNFQWCVCHGDLITCRQGLLLLLVHFLV
jgi:hypothetical protein